MIGPSVDETPKQARCACCGDRYPKRDMADYPACSLMCAGELLARIMIEYQARGLGDWKDLLPEDQRPDQVAWDAWQAGTKLGGKKHWRKLKPVP